MLRSPRLALVAGAVALWAGATLKPPTLQVDGLKVGKPGITGLTMDVGFKVRNPNPEALLIERFEYELFLNGNRLGRGYQPETINLGGFREEKIRSRFDLNYLSLPGTVKDLLEDDRAKARAKGTFYVREVNGNLKKLKFDADAEVDIRKD
jgi:LEA14-like dessication related protein